MEIKLVDSKITLSELKDITSKQFGDLVKAVVDVEKGIMAISGELHSDEEAALLDRGSEQKNLWGINLYPEQFGTDEFVEFDSMINLRPSQGNKTRGVDELLLQNKIREIVNRLVVK